jgi:hypothetical protein
MHAGARIVWAALAVAGAADAATVDRFGRPLVEGRDRVWYDASASLQPVRSGDFFAKPRRASRASAKPAALHPPPLPPAFHGDGSGFAFSGYVAFPVGSWPDTVAIADIDGDGRNDVVLATTYYFDPVNDWHVFVFLQDASGSLGAPISFAYPDTGNSAGIVVLPGTISASASAAASSEIVIGSVSGISRFLWRESGPSSALFFLGGNDNTVLARIDADPDRQPDVVALPWSDDALVFHRDRLGNFPSTTPLPSHNGGWDSMDVGDLDHDGLADLVIASPQSNEGHPIDVFWHNAAGGFDAPTVVNPGTFWYAAAGDVNGDGKGDIVASKASNSPTCLWYAKGNGDRTFAPVMAFPSYEVPETVRVADVNRDGRDDIVTLHGGWLEAGVYLQASDGGMGAEHLYDIPYATHYQATGLALGDINGDGCTDAAIADYNNGLVVMYGSGCAETAD